MAYIITFLVCGISFAPFLFFNVDIFHAQGMWVQAWMAVVVGWMLFEKPIRGQVKNVPLGALTLWLGLEAAYICLVVYAQFKAPGLEIFNQRRDILCGYNLAVNFFSYFNFLCLVFLYVAITQYLDEKSIRRIVKWLKYVFAITAIYAILQKCGLSQFFQLFFPKDVYHNNPVVGFIGNGTHLSGLLAMSAPLFLIDSKRQDYLTVALIACVMLFTGTSSNDPSAMGYVSLSLVLGIWLWKKNPWYLFIFLLSLIALVTTMFFIYAKEMDQFFNTNGRVGWLQYYWSMFHQMPITGVGLGRLNQIHMNTAYPGLRHLHLEYFQFAFEAGIIGLTLVLWLIKDFFDRKSFNSLTLGLRLVVTAFLINCCFNWQAHLWLTSTTAMFAYASFITLVSDGKEQSNGIKSKRNQRCSLKHDKAG